MNTTANKFIMQNMVFAWIAFATCVLLLVPFTAMQFTTAVDWSIADFIVMGALLFGAGSAFVLAARRAAPRHRLAIGVLVAGVFLYVWAELAVGIFTSLGS